MYPASFSNPEEISKTLLKISKIVDNDSFIEISKIFYDAVKISTIVLQRKKLKSKTKSKNCKLSKKDITKIINLLCYFHSNDRFQILKHGSYLTGCYHPSFNEDDAWEYFEKFIKGNANDKFGNTIEFPDDFIKAFYKDNNQRHEVKSEYFLGTRAKRMPLIKDTILKTTNIFQRIDDNDNLELMYINRYIDPYGKEYYKVVIVKKFKKDKTNPFIAKTSFSIFKYNSLLRRIEKYEPLKKGLSN